MIAGTTARLRVELDVDWDRVREIVFTFTDERYRKVLEKRWPADTEMEDGVIVIPLSQKETLRLDGTFYVEGQVNFRDGHVVKTGTFRRYMRATLGTEIVEDRPPRRYWPEDVRAEIAEGLVYVGTGLPDNLEEMVAAAMELAQSAAAAAGEAQETAQSAAAAAEAAREEAAGKATILFAESLPASAPAGAVCFVTAAT